MKFRYDKEKEELIVSEATRIEYHQMELWLTRYVKGYKFMPAFKMNVWDGKQKYFRDGRINLGLWKEALKGCNEINAPFIVENKEDFPINRDITLENFKNFCHTYFKDHKIKIKDEWVNFMPYDHQIETAFKILKNRYCIAEVATSGGKSLIVSLVIFYTLKHMNPDAKILIIVPSITLVTQFYDDLLSNNYGENRLVEMRENNLDLNSLSDSVCDIRIEEVMSERPRKWSGKLDANIYIGTYQSLDKCPKEFFQQFHTVICDEAHITKSKTLIKILNHTFKNAYSRFGVSGTFPVEDSCEILTIQSVLGPKIAEVSAVELKDKGIITPMNIKVVMMNHDDSEFGDRITQIRKAGYGKEALELERDYIHQSGKRMDFIKKIVNKCNNNTLILFYTIDYGQQLLKELSECMPDKDFYYIDGEISGKKREEIKKMMEITSDNVKVLIASYGTLSTGVSIRAIFNVIFADSFKSEQLVIQSIGRSLRLHSEKDEATIFDLIDIFDPKALDKFSRNQNILYSHFKEREKFYIKREYPYKIIKVNL
jgi:superfamily II DNA or RNA helicase